MTQIIRNKRRNATYTNLLLLVFILAAVVAVDYAWQNVAAVRTLLQAAIILLGGWCHLYIHSQAAKSMYPDIDAIKCAFEHIHDGIVLVADDNQILLINRAAEGLLALMPDFTIDEHSVLPLPINIRKFVRDCFETDTELSIEIDTKKANHCIIKVLGRRIPADLPGRECVLLVLTDLTEIKRAEKRQRDSISNVSHELKTPIAAIKISAEALMEGALKDTSVSEKFLHNIVDSCDRLALFVDNMIRVARFDSGSLVFERQSEDIEGVILRAQQMLVTQLEQKSITVELDVPKGLTFSIDRPYMCMAIKNLLDNASKYSPEGSKVRVSAGMENGNLRILVTDWGIGLPQGETEAIFDRYYRVDQARTYQAGGSGLGLAIVKRVVELHNGKISVDSTLGKGSTFMIQIPPDPL